MSNLLFSVLFLLRPISQRWQAFSSFTETAFRFTFYTHYWNSRADGCIVLHNDVRIRLSLCVWTHARCAFLSSKLARPKELWKLPFPLTTLIEFPPRHIWGRYTCCINIYRHGCMCNVHVWVFLYRIHEESVGNVCAALFRS